MQQSVQCSKLFQKTITITFLGLVKQVDLSCCDMGAAHLHILAKQQGMRGFGINNPFVFKTQSVKSPKKYCWLQKCSRRF